MKTIRITETDTGFNVADRILEALVSLGIKARYTTHSSEHVDLEISAPHDGVEVLQLNNVPGRRLAGGKDASPDEIRGVVDIVRAALDPISPNGTLRRAAWDLPEELLAKMRADIQAFFGASEFLVEPPCTVCIRRVATDPDGLHADVRITF